MPRILSEIELAIEVFVRGFCAEKSRTHPYEHARIGQLWVMRDAPRKNAKDYRKEEWIAYGVAPRVVHALAQQGTRGRFFVCAMRGMDEPDDGIRRDYKALGYRLLVTEPLFVHRLNRVPRPPTTARIECVNSLEMAERFGKATRTRPIAATQLGKKAPFRQYVAVEGDELVGWVRSVDADDSTWCSNLYVRPSSRRRGIGTALLARMLRDDRKRGAKQSVLLSTHTGALLYPCVGYEQLGLLLIFAPARSHPVPRADTTKLKRKKAPG
jgi:GNAT superfamily N-acetyltransferase